MEISMEPRAHPLTLPQRDIWWDQMLHGHEALYHVGGYMRLDGEIDLDAFRDATSHLVRRHDVLRTRLVPDPSYGGLPLQSFDKGVDNPLLLLDLTGEDDPEQTAQRWMRRRFSEPFDLWSGPLFRHALLRVAPASFFYFVCYHHLIADGWTVALLIRSQAEIYAARQAAAADPAPAPTYQAFIANDLAYAQSEAFQVQQRHWRRKFSSPPAPLLKARHAPSQAFGIRSAHSSLWLPREWYDRLSAFATAQGATTFHAILGAVYVYFTRTQRCDEMVMGLSMLNRANASFKATAGMFASVTAARFGFARSLSFTDLLRAIGRELKQDYRHQRFPLSHLNREAGHADAEQPQLFDIGISYERHDYQVTFGSTRGGAAQPMVAEHQVNPLMLFVREFSDDALVQVDFVYRRSHFSEEDITALQERLVHLLEAAQRSPDLSVASLPLLGRAEHERVTRTWNATAVDYPQARPVHELIEQQARTTPDATALIFEAQQLTYGMLNQAANRLAHRLIEAGVRADALVGLCAQRSVEMVVGLLAILKAGAAYVPLDPELPPQRLAAMLSDMDSGWALATAALWSRLGLQIPRLRVLDLDLAQAVAFPSTDPQVQVHPQQLAYLIYTSGSTGTPKGVGVPHAGLVNRLLWMQEAYALTPDDRVLQKTPFGFDVSVWEFLWPLMTGAVLVVALPGDHQDPARLAKLVQRHGITTLHFVPSMLQAFIDHGALPTCTSLRRVIASGEALPTELARRFRQQSPALLHNLYGPTEASIDVTAWTCIEAPDATVPIGRPIANTRVYVLDDEMQPVPVGVAGELYIGGAQLARAYHRRPDLTAERFVPDAFGRPGDRLYRSGDLARWRGDGVIEYLGRVDHQVKLHGQRIELGEIEATLQSHPGIREALVAVREDTPGDRRLVAYVVAHTAFHQQLEREQQAARVAQWQDLYDRITGASEAGTDTGLDFTGWVSSYTGEPLPEVDMQDFVAHTLERILALQPRRLLEIGCGTGSVLMNIAPHCEAYVGTDLSARTLEALQARVHRQGWDHVQLLHRPARDFSGLAEGGFDTVVINSVIQYFPDAGYLADVIEGAMRALAPGGRLFIGDVRHLSLQGAFQSAVQLFRSPADRPCSELREQTGQAMSFEKELLVAPGFFAVLQRRIPAIRALRILPKACRHDNEMSRFRYDVVLHLTPLPEVQGFLALHWQKEGLTPAGLQRMLSRGQHDALCIHDIPNARVIGDAVGCELLEKADPLSTAAALRARPEPALAQARGLSAFELAQWSAQAGYRLELSWAGGDNRGSFHALLWRPAAGPDAPVAFPHPASFTADAVLQACTNNPLFNAVRAEASRCFKAFLRERLPALLVPAHIVLLDHMPVTPNGKADRKALPAPHTHRSMERHVAPGTHTEALLAELWAELLKLDRVGANDNFFELGGHSLLAMQLSARLRQRLGLELALRVVFEAPLLSQLAARIDALRAERSSPGAAAPVCVRADRSRPLPLSFPQQRLWFLDRLAPGRAVYNMAGGLRLVGALDLAALQAALSAVVERHEALRTSVALSDGHAVQSIAAPTAVPCPLVDLLPLPDATRQTRARQLADQEASRPFDLQAAPLLRAQVLRLALDEHWLLLTVHHIASDGWSTPILLREIAAFYRAQVRQIPAGLRALAYQYADFSASQRHLADTGAWAAGLAYWRQQLAGVPALIELPTDHPRPVVQSHRGSRLPFMLPPDLSGRLRALSQQQGTSLFMTLLSAFGVLLVRHGAQEDLCIGTPVSSRHEAAFEDVIGCFINMLVLRLRMQGRPSFREVLGQVRETVLAAHAHQNLPFEQLIDALQVERSLSHSPLFQVMFMFNPPVPAITFDGLQSQPLQVEPPIAKYDLTLEMWEENDSLGGCFEYSTDLFERATVERLAEHFKTLLAAAAEQVDAPISELPVMSDSERTFLLSTLNQTRHDFPLHESYAALFAAQVAAHPERVAAVCMDEQLTYRELDDRSTRIARALRVRGAGPETLVGVLGERSLCFLASMIGVHKAGAALVPLDPGHPHQRLVELVQRSQMALLLASEESVPLVDAMLSALPAAPCALVTQRLWLDGEATPVPASHSPDALAYVVFTSGSTGHPKGAMVTHRGMLNNLLGKVPALGLGPADRVAQTASQAFDISIWQFLAAPLLGGCVHILPDAISSDPRRLLREVARQQITVLQTVPSMMRLLLAEQETPPTLHLRCVLSIGEALPPALAQSWFDRFPSIPLINIYGPAECADNVAYHVLHEAEDVGPLAELASVPIGRPTANLQLFVLDKHLQPVPIGVPGEICVAGAGVGRGYLNDPQTTAQAFIDHPVEPGGRLYRTGDRGRYRADGTIDYLGRRDHQVKVRGQRIELGEIERCLRDLPGVHDAVVLARRDEVGETCLVACWAPADRPCDTESLRRSLSLRLPAAMVPTHWAQLDQLPVNANGKVDRKALADAPWPQAQAQEDREAGPLTPTEERLHSIWCDLLGSTRIGRDDNFFHLGGHSLLAVRMISRIRDVFRLDLPLQSLFENPMLRELAARIDAAGSFCGHEEPPLVPAHRSGPLPLSFAQQRLWFLDQLHPDSALYNMPVGLRLSGALDTAALEAALDDVLVRHEVLRTAFPSAKGQAWQRVCDNAKAPLTLHDLSTLAPPLREPEAQRILAAEAQRPFDLGTAPLLRAVLLRLDAHQHLLLLTLHHIAADGWSIHVVARDLAALYHAHCTGSPAKLPILDVQYADYAVWQRSRWRGELQAKLQAFWQKQLEDAPAILALPVDHPRPAVPSYRGGQIAIEIDEPLAAALRRINKQAGTTQFMGFLSVFALLLSRYGGQSDLCIGTPVANRPRSELEHLVGFFSNTLVMRFQLDDSWTFETLLRHTRQHFLAAHAHQDMPFEQLVEFLQPGRHLSHSPLFQVMFTMEDGPSRLPCFHGLEVEALAVDSPPPARFDLSLHIGSEEPGRGLRATLDFNADLFERGTIERMGRHYVQLLRSAIAHPRLPLCELPMLTQAEQHLMLVEWNRTAADTPAHPTVHQLFEACAASHAQDTALIFQDQRLTYAELNTCANQLAHALRARGIGPDRVVGLCVERSLDMVVAILGVLKAGGAYLPLDPALPPERLAYMLRDANPGLLLTQPHLRDVLRDHPADPIVLEGGAAQFAEWPGHDPVPNALGENLAYVIYTSGSTGRPKGTLIQHRGLVNLAHAQCRAIGLQPGMRVLQWAAFNFDASVCELFTSLTTGACLHLVTKEAVLPGIDLLNTLRQGRIEVVTMTPSSLSALPAEPLPDLKILILAGEDCDHTLIAPWLKRYTVINAYGPTETTVCATVYRCTSDGLRHPPIGRPLANTQTYILDAHQHPVPVGVTGELYIGGLGLARGYLGRPDLTAERFVVNPFSDQPGARMYRTGDLARYLPGGQIEYVGRADHQVKIRGYRIELGEIEFALAEVPGVREAVVLALRAPAGGQELVAYLVPDASAAPELATQLRVSLQRSLPDYMVPAHIVMLDRLPINANGKLNRAALAALEWTRDSATTTPRTPTEERLAGLWAELLGRRDISHEENFFHAGGHSLLAVKLIALVNEAFGLSLPVSQLFLSPSIAMLGEAIDTHKDRQGRLVVPMHPGPSGGHADPVWLFHPAGGTVFGYRRLAEHLGQVRPVFAIQSAEIAGLPEAPANFESMCRHYLCELLHRQSGGQFRLAGWSLGGAIAFRLAEMLEQAGQEVAWVGLLDTLDAGKRQPLSFEEFLTWFFSRVPVEAWTADAGLRTSHERMQASVAQHGTEWLAQFDAADRGAEDTRDGPGLDPVYLAFLRQQYRVQSTHAAFMASFAPGKVRAPLHVFRCLMSSHEDELHQVDWHSHTESAGRSTEHTLSGTHENILSLENNVETISLVLQC